jgi:hypothetical protein
MPAKNPRNTAGRNAQYQKNVAMVQEIPVDDSSWSQHSQSITQRIIKTTCAPA